MILRLALYALNSLAFAAFIYIVALAFALTS